MRVAIIGLTQYENFGDQFIGKTVEYLVKQHRGGVDTKLLDFSFDKSRGNSAFILRAFGKVARLLKLQRFSDWLLVKKYASFYKKSLFKDIEVCDCIIFSCGSFKYGTQDLWAQYSVIIDYAYKHNIPVMFDAMNVQKYDSTNYKCEYLKEHLNRQCVKYFTSRDGMPGVNRLKNDYIDGGEVKVLPAADPAFWIPETYNIKRNTSSNIIGINVIAPDRFMVYGGTLKPEDVKKAYIEMLEKLNKNGFSWQLFTNGMKDDNVFADELASYFKLSSNKVRIPKSDIELAQMEAEYKAVFGARLHSMICAYSFGVPVAGFIWDEKITHFAEMAKLEDLFLNEKEVTGEAMFNVLMNALQQQDDPENRNKWKETTKTTLFAFLDECKSHCTIK